MEKMSVLLTTEGTYPYYSGGVSTWCHKLITALPEIDYSLISIIGDSLIAQKYELPDNVIAHTTIPLWGNMESFEHLDWVPFSSIFLSKIETTYVDIQEKFLPVFAEIIDEILSLEKETKDFGRKLFELYVYFRTYDYDITMKSKIVYDFYKEKILCNLENNKYFFAKSKVVPSIYELEQSLGLIFRFFKIINTQVSKTDITHSSAAGFCGVSNVIAKHLYGSPYLLTEHGVYIREQYLSEQRKKMPLFLRDFLISFTDSIVKLNYEFADTICPVCSFNSNWEKEFGVNPQKIEVIYNGVDPEVFVYRKSEKDKKRVIAIARVDPLKDIENFIRAARKVIDVIPEVEFAVYGAISDEDYYRKCIKLNDSLGLKNKLKFHGHIKKPEMAYHQGDVVVLSSISEGFPYSVVEAMMCGKCVVATDVGGVKEALDFAGITVPPKNPEELANACIKLLENKELREELGMKAYQKAKKHFTIKKFADDYLEKYKKIILRSNKIYNS